MNKILFILKKRQGYGGGYSQPAFSSGLFNSASFVVDMLDGLDHVEAKLVEVVDNNEIDKHVSEYKPDTVIIEALWVVPEKFEVLQKLHPNVLWIVRLHSDTPFLAGEGVAIDWLFKYTRYCNVRIAANSEYAVYALSQMLDRRVMYLPNYYPIIESGKQQLHIGCFGAVRPMKNQLTQAIAAIAYAEQSCRTLYFHINGSRIEQGANNLKNIRALFEHVPHVLVEHPWMAHGDFLKVIASMDLGMQVSLSETYNIVAADFVRMNVPIVVSEEIEFIAQESVVNNTKDIQEIVMALESSEVNAYHITRFNRERLAAESADSKDQWSAVFCKLKKKEEENPGLFGSSGA